MLCCTQLLCWSNSRSRLSNSSISSFISTSRSEISLVLHPGPAPLKIHATPSIWNLICEIADYLTFILGKQMKKEKLRQSTWKQGDIYMSYLPITTINYERYTNIKDYNISWYWFHIAIPLKDQIMNGYDITIKCHIHLCFNLDMFCQSFYYRIPFLIIYNSKHKNQSYEHLSLSYINLLIFKKCL